MTEETTITLIATLLAIAAVCAVVLRIAARKPVHTKDQADDRPRDSAILVSGGEPVARYKGMPLHGIPANAVRPGSRLVDDGDVLTTARFPVVPGQVGRGSVSVTEPSLDDDDAARRRRESDDSSNLLLTTIIAAEALSGVFDTAPAQAEPVVDTPTNIDTPSVGSDTGSSWTDGGFTGGGGGDTGGAGASGDW